MDKMPEQTPPTILVVDDDDGVRKVLTRWVTEMGYAVFAAGDALTALDLMRQFPVDVALCDIRMPGHDGIWLIEQIGRIHPDVAIVLATGLVEMDPMVTLRPGVVGYVVKPFNRDELERVVKRGLSERKRLERECRRGSRMLSAALLEDLVVPTE
jgi:DNA-binding NtrC family response regulator